MTCCLPPSCPPGNCYARGGILHFLLFDPSYSAGPDPRPALPATFIAPDLGRVVARTDWTSGATSFAYKCSWEAVNHMLADCGQFEVYRKGEWVTKENTGYATGAWCGGVGGHGKSCLFLLCFVL